MNKIENLYKQNPFKISSKILDYYQLRGILKKKKFQSLRRLLGIMDVSEALFFEFFYEGQIYAYFSDDPQKNGKFLNYFPMSEILEILENYDNKKDHFVIKYSEGMLHFKLEDTVKRIEWIAAFKFFKNLYPPNPEPFQKIAIVDEYDLIGALMIQKEVEFRGWEKNKENLNFSNFINQKKLTNFVEKNMEFLKHRIIIASAQQETIKRGSIKEIITSKKPEDQSKNNNFQIGTKKVYILALSPNLIFHLDQTADDQEMDYLDSSLKPEWLNYFNVYFFLFEDVKEIYQQFLISSIEGIWLEKQSNFIMIQFIEYKISLKFNTAIETFICYEGLGNMMNICKNIKHSELQLYKYPIENWYQIYNYQQGQGKLKKKILTIIAKLQENLQNEEFYSMLKNITENFKIVLDNFYAETPFYNDMYEFCVKSLYQEIIISMNKFWNEQQQQFSIEQIIQFCKIKQNFEKMIQKFELKILKIQNFEEISIKVYLNKILVDNIEQISKSIINLKNEFYEEEEEEIKNKFQEEISVIFQNAFQFYEVQSDIQTAKSLLNYIAILMGRILNTIFQILQTEKLKLEILISILSTNFEKIFKDFAKFVNKMTNQKIQEIENHLVFSSYNKFTQQIQENTRQNMSLILKEEINQKLNQGDFLNFEYKDKCTEILDKFSSKTSCIKNKGIKKELFEEIFLYFAENFQLKFFNFCSNVTMNNYDQIIKKIDELKNFISSQEKRTFKQGNNAQFVFTKIKGFFISDNVDEVCFNLINMNIFNKKKLDLSQIKQYLKSKIYFPQESIEYVIDYFQKSLNQETVFVSQKQKMFQCFIQCLKFIVKMSKLKRTYKQKNQNS